MKNLTNMNVNEVKGGSDCQPRAMGFGTYLASYNCKGNYRSVFRNTAAKAIEDCIIGLYNCYSVP